MKRKFLLTIAAALCAIFFAAPLSGCGTGYTFKWVLGKIEEHYLWDIPEDYEFNGSVKEFTQTYLDEYSSYYTKAEYQSIQSSNQGNKRGYGFSYSFVRSGAHPQGLEGVIISRVIGNSPAYFSGLKVGENITAVEVDGERKTFSTDAEYSEILQTDSPVTLVCDRHAGGHTLKAEEYVASYVSMSTDDATYSIVYEKDEMKVVQTQGGISELPHGAAYMRLDQFYGNAAEETAALIREFNANRCTSLIFDLRGNGGGYVRIMQQLAYNFCGSSGDMLPDAMYAVYKNGEKEAYPVTNWCGDAWLIPVGTKISVLADGNTASASEALIGVLIDNAAITYSDIYLPDYSAQYLNWYGPQMHSGRTFGKGIMQSTFVNAYTGDAIKLTVAKTYWPKGERCIHGTGVSASDGCCTLPCEWGVEYVDNFLASAIAQIYAPTVI